MYKTGDKIVYPLYGAGLISTLETKEIDGQVSTYYVLNIPVGNLTISVSAAKATELGVRFVLPKETILGELESIKAIEADMPENWNLRFKENMARIKTGILSQVAIVFYSLLVREGHRGLSTAEKKMMTTSKQIILSELMLSLDMDRQAAEDALEAVFPSKKHGDAKP